MPRVLNKIAGDNEQRKLNENFDRLALDIADRSGRFSSTATVLGGIELVNGGVGTLEINILDQRNNFEQGKLPVVPRIDVFIDHDLDYNHAWPYGGLAEAADIYGTSVFTLLSRTTINPIDDEKATYFIHIRNDSGNTHTYYVYFDAFYIPAPDLGVAARATS